MTAISQSAPKAFAPRPIRTALLHAAAVVAIALLALGSFGVLIRTLHVEHSTLTGADALERGRLLAQRIAGSSARYALGDERARTELRASIDELTATQRELARMHAAVAQSPQLAAFLRAARRAVALPPHATALRAAVMPPALDPGGPLLDAFAADLRANRLRAQRSALLAARMGLGLTLALLALLAAQTLGIVRPTLRRLTRLAGDIAAYARLATTDPVTGTLNGRGFQDRSTIEIHKARRYNRPLSLLLINPDDLEPISAAHGADAGNAVLQALSSTLFAGTRITDLVGRVDGGEFAVLLPETDLAGAQLLAERLRARIGGLTVPIADTAVSCTVSIGVSAAEKDAAFFWPTFARADEALYEAKMRGRNRVFVNSA